MSNHYETLGVNRNASDSEIKKAYRKLANEYHPDHGGDEDKFKELNEAYSTLSDPQKRQEYDNPSPFGNVFGATGSPFAGFRPRPPRRPPDLNRPADGKFLGVEVVLPMKTYIFGGTFKLTTNFKESCVDCGGKGFTTSESCSHCNGTGFIENVVQRNNFRSISSGPCPHCRGLGVTPTDECESCEGSGTNQVMGREIMFDIPPGTPVGSKFIRSGEGRVGINGGRQGDVGIIIGGITKPDVNKLSEEQVETLKELLDNAV